MKIAVINFSGNVGKTTLARHLLAPRMNDAEVIRVESINSDDGEATEESVRGKQFGQVLDALAVLDDAVVDIGASNVEDLMHQMRAYSGSHEDFDFFVVPTVANYKQQRDTVATIEALAEIGVPSKKIRIVFNQIELNEQPERVFPGLFAYHSESKKFTLKPEAAIQSNELFGRLKTGSRSIREILDDQTDLKAELKAATETEEKLRISAEISIRRLAVGVNRQLDAVFAAVTK